MSDLAIRVSHLSKRYQIGRAQLRSDTLREAIVSALRRSESVGANGEATIWAVKDLSFEVRHGEAVGIIGRNGAGKSTLLKILSRITAPTAGRVELYGRVGSLLEVGTGFHPELTGRENIYLNGAILGMRREEIERKFDEIVAFAEVEKFIDTPVKRYSSGMYLRLAFAVAAHLEQEILIVDEVLAVGDAAFQKKCLGKMGDAARQGRTVLFVSHNMQAVSQLTNHCLVLEQGVGEFDGPTAEAVKHYSVLQAGGANTTAYYEAPRDGEDNQLAAARVLTSDERGVHRWGQPITFEFVLRVVEPRQGLCFSFQVVNELQQPVCHFWLLDPQAPYRQRAGRFRLRCQVPKLRLYLGAYSLTTWLSDRRSNLMLQNLSGICPFEVTMQGTVREEYEWMPGACAYLEDAVWAPVQQEA